MKMIVLGHQNPDCDSLCSAIGLSALFNKLGKDATPALQGEPNPEALFLLEQSGLPQPEIKTSVAGEEIFIVDYSDWNQGTADMKQAKICGIVDHHKLGGLVTSAPLDCWIRAVGCTNTIIKEMFDYYEVDIPKDIASAMMCAILSDTVIFKSPTCTKIDTKVTKQLAKIAEIEDFKAIGLEMFKVKSQVDGVPFRDLVKRDFKNFEMHGNKVGIGQLEVVDLSIFDTKKDDLIADIKKLKEEEGYETVLLILTDIMAMGSQILVATSSIDIIEKAWDIKVENDQFWLKGCLSRKKQVIPFLEPAYI